MPKRHCGALPRNDPLAEMKSVARDETRVLNDSEKCMMICWQETKSVGVRGETKQIMEC